MAHAQEPIPAFRDGRIQFTVDLRAYRLLAGAGDRVRRSSRRGITTILSEVVPRSLAVVALTFPGAITEASAVETARQFHQELLDQELREQISRETAPLRDLVLAHAYSRTGLPSDEG